MSRIDSVAEYKENNQSNTDCSPTQDQPVDLARFARLLSATRAQFQPRPPEAKKETSRVQMQDYRANEEAKRRPVHGLGRELIPRQVRSWLTSPKLASRQDLGGSFHVAFGHLHLDTAAG
jgi:hypothetical protein